jgi:hypothetical protein
VNRKFSKFNEKEIRLRSVMKRMESDFVKTMIEFRNG